MSEELRPLLVTDDAALLDDVLRLAAAADVEVQVAHSVAHARRSWASAPAILVGVDLADEMARGKPSRRAGVVLVGDDSQGSEVWQQAVALGAEHVLFLPDAESWLVDRLADAAEGSQVDADVVSVLGGRGGAGASTLAAGLAVAGIRAGKRSMLVDADPLGGGLDLVLGVEQTSGSRWSDFVGTRGRVSGSALHGALPRVGEMALLSCDRDSPLPIPIDTMRSVLASARRGCELVVVDLPRHLGGAAEEVLAQSTTALLVVPAEVRATVGAARLAGVAAHYATDLRVVVRGPAPSGLSPDVIAQSLGLELAGEMRTEPGLAAAIDRGEPPLWRRKGPLAQFCSTYVEAATVSEAA